MVFIIDVGKELREKQAKRGAEFARKYDEIMKDVSNLVEEVGLETTFSTKPSKKFIVSVPCEIGIQKTIGSKFQIVKYV